MVEDGRVRDVTIALDVLPGYHYALPLFDPLIANLESVMARVRSLAAAAVMPIDSVRLLSPVANPGKIVCAPVKYQKHLDEIRQDAQLHHHNTGIIAPIHTAGLVLKGRPKVSVPSSPATSSLPLSRASARWTCGPSELI